MVNFQLSKEEIVLAFEEAINMIAKNDYELLSGDVHEQALSHRFAMYLCQCEKFQEAETKGLRVDCEYNRMGTEVNVKKLKNANIDINKNGEYRPDIILHERGLKDNNLIYCEIKKNSSSNNDDFKIVKEFVGNEGFKYRYGINFYKFNAFCAEFDLYTKETFDNPEKFSYQYNAKTKKFEKTQS